MHDGEEEAYGDDDADYWDHEAAEEGEEEDEKEEDESVSGEDVVRYHCLDYRYL